MPRKSAKQLEREAKAAQRAAERKQRLQQQKEQQQAMVLQLQQREGERKRAAAEAEAEEQAAAAADSGDEAAAAAAPSSSGTGAGKRAQSSRSRKRPRNHTSDDEDNGAAAASAHANGSSGAAAAAAAAADSSAPVRSRNSTRIVRRPGRPDDSSDDDESAQSQSSARKSGGGTKRARSSAAAAAVAALPDLLDPDELPDEWRCSANDALTFRLVRSSPEKETSNQNNQVEILNFHPHYTHQLWDDEEIVGYKRVKALVAFTSGALYTYLNVEYDSKCPDTDVADIATLIGSKLRGGFTTDYEDFRQHVHDPFKPPGTLMAEYSIPSVDHSFKETISYEVYRGGLTDPLMRAYHARLQFFLLFFIDRSSYINDSDPVWEVILLFQKRVTALAGAAKGAAAAAGANGTVTTYHIVGYTTLYKFLAYPSDWKMRLSQILILPPYQRSGHGQKLLQLVYAEAEKRNMIEVNIEDPRSLRAHTSTIQTQPHPVFQMLRDLTDINLCRKQRFFEKGPPSSDDPDPLDKWDVEYARRVKAALRITMAQVRRCYEIFKLNAVNDRHKNSKSMVAYRLEVKARLFHEEREVLSLYSQKPEERKEKLAEIYNELEQHYLAVIKKARLH